MTRRNDEVGILKSCREIATKLYKVSSFTCIKNDIKTLLLPENVTSYPSYKQCRMFLCENLESSFLQNLFTPQICKNADTDTSKTVGMQSNSQSISKSILLVHFRNRKKKFIKIRCVKFLQKIDSIQKDPKDHNLAVSFLSLYTRVYFTLSTF